MCRSQLSCLQLLLEELDPKQIYRVLKAMHLSMRNADHVSRIDMIGVTVGSRNLSPPPPPKRPPPPKQLIKNHKFEEGEGFVVPHWGIQRNYGYCAWGIFPNNGYSGNRSLQFFSADMRQQQWTARLTQDVTVVPFSSYEVRIWAKYAYSGCGIVFEYNDIGLGAWALRDEYRLYQAVIPENATTYEAGRLVFQIRCINEGRGGAFIDAITMTEIGSKQPPPPLPPLGSTSEFGN